jgi:CheY-like chemotaxis protein
MPDKALLVSVVDDDESVRESLPDLLIELGHSVRTFSSALEFLASDTADQTWCPLLDVSMPGMSGVELQVELKRHDKRIPIIFITATGDDVVRAQVVELGAVACLRKPFSDTALVEALRSVMTPNSVLSVDHTDIFGYNLWRTLDINPIINGVRPALHVIPGPESERRTGFITTNYEQRRSARGHWRRARQRSVHSERAGIEDLPIGSDGRFKIAAFGELYNITDRANFGNNYGDGKGTATYQLPTGYIGGFGAVSTTPNSFQVQFGARFTY